MDDLQKFYNLHVKKFAKKEFNELDEKQKAAIKQIPAYSLFVQREKMFKDGLIKATKC